MEILSSCELGNFKRPELERTQLVYTNAPMSFFVCVFVNVCEAESIEGIYSGIVHKVCSAVTVSL